MSIGEVLAQLRPEFPEVTISKLRFLEAEGLVEPRRTASGYRKYSWADVARLRFVLTAQRDEYLPLRVIRERLAGRDRVRPALMAVGDTRSGGVPTPAERATAERAAAERVTAGVERLTRADLAERAGVPDDLIRDLEQYGLLAPRPGGWYAAEALVVVEVAARLAEFGVQGRHLRGYRAAADREIGLFAQLVSASVRQSDPTARARAEEMLCELAALSQRLHTALVRAGLRDTLRG
jgi:DNA-binding transcriptional MerR regulator